MVDLSLVSLVPEGFRGILCPTVSAKALDSKPEGNHHRPYIKLDGGDDFMLGLDEVDTTILGELVGNIADVSRAAHRRRRDRPHEIDVDYMKQHGDLGVGLLQVTLLDALPDGADVARR